MEQMRMKRNETARSMVEMLGVLAVVCVLSLTVVAGITYAMRRQAVVDTVDLINKSSAGILTSGFLKEDTGSKGNLSKDLLVPLEQIPLNAYMSNVTLTSATEKTKYGNETFVGPRGSVFSAYPSAVQGGGFMLAVNNMQSAVCEDVLSYDLDYDAVVRVGTDGQPIRDFVDAIDLDDAPKRKDFCRLGEDEEALNVGFVFNKISPDDDGSNQPECNSNCSIAILGDCGLTKTEACAERQYYATDCTCQCYVGSLANGCACPTNTPVWNTTTKQCEACPTETPKWNSSVCVECLTNTDCTDSTKPLCDAGTCVACSGNTPVWNVNTNTCEACPTSTPVWNDVDKKCEACPTSTPVWNGSSCEACLTGTPKWNGSVCVECLTNTDCTDSAKPLCDVGTCVACPTGTPKWNSTTGQCEACPNATPEWDSANGVCVQCLDNSHCSGNTPVCNGDTNTCEACPKGEVWDANDKTCRATQEGAPCSSDEDCGNMICTPVNYVDMTGQDTNNNTKYDRSCCPKDKPFWNGSACSETFEITKRYGYIDTGSLVNSLIFELGAYPFDYTLKCNMMIDDAIYFNGGDMMKFWGGTGPFTRDVNKGETLTTTLWNNRHGHAATGSCTINPK